MNRTIAAWLRRMVPAAAIGLIAAMSAMDRAAATEPVRFLSTQFAPVQEAQGMREILKDFVGEVVFQPYDSLALVERLTSEGEGAVSLIAGIHGDMVSLTASDLLRSMDDIADQLGDRGVPSAVFDIARLGGHSFRYIPWVQTTYLMVARREALAYLPEGARLDRLTYLDLIDWAQAMQAATGQARLGFPAGPRGLMHRFIHGYLYPSYTGGGITSLRDLASRMMWQDMRALWEHTNIRSLTYNGMAEPLLSEDVWVAWDHVARLLPALNAAPDDFVVFPAPLGPRGRGVIVVTLGLAIPANAPQPAEAQALIEYLSRPSTAARMAAELGYFPFDPAVADRLGDPALSQMVAAIATQSAAPDTLVGVLPPDFGGGAETFSLSYLLAFTRIVLRGADIDETLATVSGYVTALLEASRARCWPPDPIGMGPCQIR